MKPEKMVEIIPALNVPERFLLRRSWKPDADPCHLWVSQNIFNILGYAVERYATDNCATSFWYYQLVTTDPQNIELNDNDLFTFKVAVFNYGPLDMKNVKVRVLGTDWAWVGPAPEWNGNWYNSLDSQAQNIPASSSWIIGMSTFGPFYGKPKGTTSGVKTILQAQIISWDASLDHILLDHSGAGAKEGSLDKEIKGH